MDKLDRLLAQLDQQVASAETALAALACTRRNPQPSDHALTAIVWRQGAAGKPAKTLSFPTEAQGGTAHQQMAEQRCLQGVRDAARALQHAILDLSAFLAAGPDLRRLKAWPAFHLMVGLHGAESRLSLQSQAPTGVVFGATWPWEQRGFHRVCRLLFETQARLGHGPEWSYGGTSHKTRRALDAEAALLFHALCGRPELFDHHSTNPFVLARIEPDLDGLVAKLRGTDAATTTRGLPAF